jgi:hypothetical protein
MVRVRLLPLLKKEGLEPVTHFWRAAVSCVIFVNVPSSRKPYTSDVSDTEWVDGEAYRFKPTYYSRRKACAAYMESVSGPGSRCLAHSAVS